MADETLTPDFRLDLSGEPCPYPVVATLETMPNLQPGEILEVLADLIPEAYAPYWLVGLKNTEMAVTTPYQYLLKVREIVRQEAVE